MTRLFAIDEGAFEAMIERMDRIERRLEALKPESEWVSILEYAEAKGVMPRTVRNWIAQGRLEARGSGMAREVRR
ncbi:hypothetical protein [Pontibaca methylaminivorans]|uniref:Helix-turn-helix domain-containing protein n=1 Tax=Pontibaca methylaminivorans TaxID=515897 RepID=A0A1R3W924_9RHOB|nr:hypothetical protein [Pontibaca methylaminivorans]SIT74522.1 hypothetical protein SAMN05421849_0172 [Pontibaca methylaminivorans]